MARESRIKINHARGRSLVLRQGSTRVCKGLFTTRASYELHKDQQRSRRQEKNSVPNLLQQQIFLSYPRLGHAPEPQSSSHRRGQLEEIRWY